MERFFLNLKMESIWLKDYANHAEAANDIADHIVGFYNSIRLHLKLGNLSPNAFERESTSKQSIQLSEFLDHYIMMTLDLKCVNAGGNYAGPALC